ncbi:iron ABC transporter permease [Hahella aquimaris]|uniref:FecCD family ABC transporter permease n=1 Tax=Hahella sp. HNIBRBA332 TaxID=3015983 RepID=UPI00273B6A7D|nr:iron ABC transporter permease [Hahella sp. HNIBRBA332]WLQ16397.1 iron ABC transporter permease [Hahella sp. HNIBRBA332]
MFLRYLRAGRNSGRALHLFLALLVLAAAFSASVALGQISMPLSIVLDAFTAFDPASTEHIIVTTTRLSRALTALCVGSALAVAGALMQALTRNPLASPGIFGVNAGALFAIALSTTLFSVPSLQHYIWIAFAGAAVAGTLVYCLSALGRDGLTPVRTVLAGAAITALFVSFTQGLLVINQEGLDSILFWLAGSVAGRSLELVAPVAPFILFAIVASMALGRHINVLMSGDEVAKGLGQRTAMLRLLMGVLIIGLAGAAVAIAGNIVFVGLIVPHMVRAWLGADYRWVLPGCAVLGAVLLLSADVAARFLIPPQEVPIGVMTALLGTPFFIYLARRSAQHG